MGAPIHRILVPVDFSEGSRAALEYALRLAEPLGATVSVVHVFAAPIYAGAERVAVPGHPGHSIAEYVCSEEAEELRAFVASIPGASARVEKRLMAGDPAGTIAEASRGHDLVVMGRHGRTGLAHLVLGSVTERVLRKARCPVLVIRDPQHAHLEEEDTRRA
jgi:nucleotide-binding universal stress UspA family protein